MKITVAKLVQFEKNVPITIENSGREIIENLLSRCKQSQIDFFDKLYPKGVKPINYGRAIKELQHEVWSYERQKEERRQEHIEEHGFWVSEENGIRYSGCCSAPIHEEGLCSDCKEHIL